MCGKAKADPSFLAGSGKRQRVSSACTDCRREAAKQHVQRFYRRLPPDERHTLTHKKRAIAAGVAHEAYSRTEVLQRWRYQCCYCDNRATHLDHVIPLKLGGDDMASNIVPACASCNLRKGARSLADWAFTP